jgi:hypothetical protein
MKPESKIFTTSVGGLPFTLETGGAARLTAQSPCASATRRLRRGDVSNEPGMISR